MRKTIATLVVVGLLAIAGCGDYSDPAVLSARAMEPVEAEHNASEAVQPAIDLACGQTVYAEMCERCHRARGANCTGCRDFSELAGFIEASMPQNNPGSCTGTCARDVAAYITNGYSAQENCFVAFTYDSISENRFSATLSIQNRGDADVPSWSVGLRFGHQETLVSAEQATAEEAEGVMVVRSNASTPLLARGGDVVIAIAGEHQGQAQPPVALVLEAAPCFAEPPSGQPVCAVEH